MLDKIIIMLTHNDQTVPNAQEIFDSCKDLPIRKWGFKDVGLEPDKMFKLCQSMKAAGKETFLEVVTYTEEECMRGAKLARDCGFDYLLGTIYYESVLNFAKLNGLKFCPFVGEVSGSPSILEGTLEGMLAQQEMFASKGVFGIDLLGYRYTQGDPNVLSAEFIKGSKLPVVLAGSIASEARIDLVKKMNPWCFTMGSALFTNAFGKGGVKENLEYVVEYLKKISD